jgi:hypothetical protein
MALSSSKDITKKFGLTLPPKVAQLFDKGWKSYDGFFIKELPNYQSDPHTGMKIKFDDKKARSQGEEWDVEWDDALPFFPLALITFEDGEADAQLLAVDIENSLCPVVMFEHETGEFEEVADSLDEFLGDLVKP